MTALRDTAKAKLNLTLEVLGRRADGYHEVRSLVGFTELGDSVALEPGDELALAVDGPFAGALQGDNLIIAAAEAAKAKAPGIALGRFHLTKTLPVAAGLGGGSADAAAALRLLAEANPGTLSPAALAGDRRPPRLRRDGLPRKPAGADDRQRRAGGRRSRFSRLRRGAGQSRPAARHGKRLWRAQCGARFQPGQRMLSRCPISAEASSA